MKKKYVFISHKYWNVNKLFLKKRLTFISNILEDNGYETFIYFRDVQKWTNEHSDPGIALEEALSELKKCDIVLGVVYYKEISQGMLLEYGYAKALRKKTVLLLYEKYPSPVLENLSDKVIKFKDQKDLREKLNNM